MREIEIALQLKHPSIVESYDFGEEHGELFFVMEYCAGGNLREVLDRSAPLSVRRTLRLLDRVLAGVEEAHSRNIVHRDLKPSNILLHSEQNRRYIPKVGDFGLAKNYLLAGESGLTASGSIGGSWKYMPKEQLLNFRFVSPQSDIWSLGAIVYECLTNRLPRGLNPDADPIKQILNADTIPITSHLPELPKPIVRFVMKSISVQPEERFRDAGQMRKVLQQTASSSGIDLS